PCNTSLNSVSAAIGMKKAAALLPPLHSEVRHAPCVRDLGRLLDLRRRAGADRDRPRTHPLRKVPHQVDVEEPVLEVGALHLDMIGELEPALEAAGRDAAVQVAPLALALLGLLLAAHGERALLHIHLDLIGRETGNRHGDAVLVLAEALDVVRRIGGGEIAARGAVEELRRPAEAAGRAVERRTSAMAHA